jgi:hypothetical protein
MQYSIKHNCTYTNIHIHDIALLCTDIDQNKIGKLKKVLVAT